MCFDIVSKVLAFDKIHHHIATTAIGVDFVDRNNVGVAEVHHCPRFANKVVDLFRVICISVAKHFNRFDFARFYVHATINPSKGSRSDQIENFPLAVKISPSLTFDQTSDLKVGELFLSHQLPFKAFESRRFTTHRHNGLGDLLLAHQIRFENSGGKFFGGDVTHENGRSELVFWGRFQMGAFVGR